MQRLKFVFIPLLLFAILIITYFNIQTRIPISYWDEFLWVGRGYFIEPFIKGDYRNQMWQSMAAYDQPKLTELTYGAWLYPLFIKEKNRDRNLSYINYLVSKGFFDAVDQNYIQSSVYKNNPLQVFRPAATMSGTVEDWINKYGQKSADPLLIITNARRLNIFLLAGAVVVGYLTIASNFGFLTGIVSSIFYGFNDLLIATGLKAHSEALFLLMFNLSLYYLFKILKKKYNLNDLVLFAIFSGLCAATKLNGVMLLMIYIFLSLFLIIAKKGQRLSKVLIKIILPTTISILIFIFLNPFTYQNPILNILKMYQSRFNIASNQAVIFSKFKLPGDQDRLTRAIDNFYFKGYEEFSGEIVSVINVPPEVAGPMKLILFFIGVIYLLGQVLLRNPRAFLWLLIFFFVLEITLKYLVLDWPRYYVHLEIFIIGTQSIGISAIVGSLIRNLKPNQTMKSRLGKLLNYKNYIRI